MLQRACGVQGCNDIFHWWRDHRLEFSALNDLARNTKYVLCDGTSSAASEPVFGMAGQVVNNIRENLKISSVNDILFLNSAFKATKKALKVDQKVSRFSSVFLRASVGFEMNH